MSNNNTSVNYNGQIFKKSSDINNFFSGLFGVGFPDWFNSQIQSLNPWTYDYLNNRKEYFLDKTNWNIFWNNIPLLFQRDTINLIEFLCLNSIVINETGGSFISKLESVNKSGNPTAPGIAYEFNGSGGKSSYNTSKPNLTAYACFNDPNFIKVNGTKGLANILKNTTDSRWQSETFPLGFSGLSHADETSETGKANGFLIEADFFKFRGRGYIQITNRSNYKNLLNYVLSYSGNDNSVLSIQSTWKKFGKNLDTILTCSTNKDWDALFLNKNYSLALWAVGNYLVNHYRKPLPISADSSPNGLQASILNFGASISGGKTTDAYPKLFYQRVIAQLNLINNAPTVGTPLPMAASMPVISQTYSRAVETNSQNATSQTTTTGQLSSITNIFGATIKPGPIIIDIT